MKTPGKLRSGTEVDKKNNRLQSRKHKQELPFFFGIAYAVTKKKKDRTEHAVGNLAWAGMISYQSTRNYLLYPVFPQLLITFSNFLSPRIPRWGT